MPFIITGIIAIILFIGGVSVVKNSQTQPSVSPTPTIIIQETTTPIFPPPHTPITIPTITETPTLTATLAPTHTIIDRPTPTTKLSTPIPTIKVFIPTVTPIQIQSNKSSFQCNCSKTCPQMASCEEAYFQLLNCGCSKRDGDKDGVPCEEICPGG